MTRRAAALAHHRRVRGGPGGSRHRGQHGRYPGSSAVTRLNEPRWVRPGIRPVAAGERTMASQAGPTEFTGALLYGVSCTGKAQCTAVTTRSGKNSRTLAEQWNGSTWTQQTAPR
jgi:hypothetical protein